VVTLAVNVSPALSFRDVMVRRVVAATSVPEPSVSVLLGLGGGLGAGLGAGRGAGRGGGFGAGLGLGAGRVVVDGRSFSR
jgi:hypothetical protein